jgi:hypothetical protein
MKQSVDEENTRQGLTTGSCTLYAGRGQYKLPKKHIRRALKTLGHGTKSLEQMPILESVNVSIAHPASHG